MTIGMILKKFEPSTGKSRHVLEVSKRLVAQGHRVHLVTNEVRWDGDASELAHLQIHTIGGSQNALYFRESDIVKFLEEQSVDVIELHGGLMMSLFAKRFSRVVSTPLVLNIHSQPTDILKEWRYLSFSDLRYDRKYIVDVDDVVGLVMRVWGYQRFWNHPKIRAIIVPSKQLRETYQHDPRMVWIPSGADIHHYRRSSETRVAARARLGYRDKEKVVLFFSRAVMVRGMDTLIQAMERVSDALDDVRLAFFVLPDVDVERLRKMVQTSRIADRIDLHIGRDPRMHEALQAADVCAFPFRTTGCIPEQPLTLLEAMASEKAVVSTSIGSIPEIITDGTNGLLAPPNDPIALSQALIRILKHPEFRDQLAWRARETIEQMYNWDRITEQTLKVYETASSTS